MEPDLNKIAAQVKNLRKGTVIDSGSGVSWQILETFKRVKNEWYGVEKGKPFNHGSSAKIRRARKYGSQTFLPVTSSSGVGPISIQLNPNQPREYALKMAKVIKKDHCNEAFKNFQVECNALKKLGRFAEYEEIEVVDKYTNKTFLLAILVEKFVEGNNLYKDLKDLKLSGRRLTVQQSRDYKKQLLQALIDVQACGLIHGDLHAGNVINTIKMGNPMIIDFGSANRYYKCKVAGNTDFDQLAPELTERVGKHFFTFQSDVYALGVLFKKISERTGYGYDQQARMFDLELEGLMCRALPNERPSCIEVDAMLDKLSLLAKFQTATNVATSSSSYSGQYYVPPITSVTTSSSYFQQVQTFVPSEDISTKFSANGFRKYLTTEQKQRDAWEPIIVRYKQNIGIIAKTLDAIVHFTGGCPFNQSHNPRNTPFITKVCSDTVYAYEIYGAICACSVPGTRSGLIIDILYHNVNKANVAARVLLIYQNLNLLTAQRMHFIYDCVKVISNDPDHQGNFLYAVDALDALLKVMKNANLLTQPNLDKIAANSKTAVQPNAEKFDFGKLALINQAVQILSIPTTIKPNGILCQNTFDAIFTNVTNAVFIAKSLCTLNQAGLLYKNDGQINQANIDLVCAAEKNPKYAKSVTEKLCGSCNKGGLNQGTLEKICNDQFLPGYSLFDSKTGVGVIIEQRVSSLTFTSLAFR